MNATAQLRASGIDSIMLGSDDSDTVLLESLNFTDLYIRVDAPGVSRYRIGPNAEGHAGIYVVDPKYDYQINYLRTQIEKCELDEGTITQDTMRLRFSRARVVDNSVWASIRRIPYEVPDLADLGLLKTAVSLISSWSRRRGIVAIGGATGAGKTTTAVSAIKEFLTISGGIAVAIEDPAEYLMQGEFGEKGFCFQIEIASEGGWSDAVKTALRWRPRYIFLGEVRTPEAARQALRASTSGHLVITTVHGGSVEEALGSLLRLAEADMGPVARSLLADNLVGVVYQKLSPYGPDVDILAVRKDRNRDEIRKLVHEGKLAALSSYTQPYPAPRPASSAAR